MRIVRSVVLLLALAACGGGGDGPPTGNNEPVASITINGVGGTSIEIGEAWSLSVVLRDAQDRVLSGRAVTWAAAPQGRVSLSSATGVTTTVTGTSTGNVTITAASEGKTATASFSVTEAGQAPLTASVTLTSSTFSPSNVTIKSGGTVTWSNTSNEVHDLTWDDVPPAGVQSVNPFNPSTQSTSTFGSTGAFDYHCSRHGGMNGRVTVVP